MDNVRICKTCDHFLGYALKGKYYRSKEDLPNKVIEDAYITTGAWCAKCHDPVYGLPVECNDARAALKYGRYFCGIDGRYWQRTEYDDNDPDIMLSIRGTRFKAKRSDMIQLSLGILREYAPDKLKNAAEKEEGT